MITTQQLDLLFLTETWLDSNFDDSHFNLYNFQIFRSDRVIRKGGGVAILVKNVFPAVRVESDVLHGSLHDLVCVDLHTNNQIYRLICVYRPPGEIDAGRLDMLSLVNRLKKLLVHDRVILLLGDFNLPLVNWQNNTYPSDGIHDRLLNLCLQRNFEQLILEPTRYDAILDLLFVNDPHIIANYVIAPPLGTGDHNVILFSSVGLFSFINRKVERMGNSIALWNAEAIAKAKHFLNSFDWNSVFKYELSPEDIWQGFRNVLLQCVNTFAQIKNCSVCVDEKIELNWRAKRYKTADNFKIISVEKITE